MGFSKWKDIEKQEIDEIISPLETKRTHLGIEHSDEIIDNGPYTVEKSKDNRLYIQSHNFKYDVIIRINGDFISEDEKIEYHQFIANKLNS